MSLPAAALAVLVAAWSAQPSQAESGRSVRKPQNVTPAAQQSAAPATEAQSPAPATSKPRFFNPLAKLKQLTGGESKSKPAPQASQIQQVGHEATHPGKSPKSPATTAEGANKISTAAYKDEPKAQDAAPAVAAPVVAAPPRALPAPHAVPGLTGPAVARPASQQPSMAPLPGYNNAPGVAVVPGYPYLNAPLNTTPVPNVPYQVGSTMITNQAFAPQEMLYAHKYRAMYPPYYYKVRGHWIVTPWGVQSNDHWELQGTEVKVNYRSSYSPFSMFTPPHYK
jgi:hypothetical protein